MIWLASFPRSGNTFFRNVLFEVYGIESSTFHNKSDRLVDDNYSNYQFVKTHLLPHEVIPSPDHTPSVYLIRDGRDALVSMAHHRKDITEPGTDFESNLLQAILAERGTYFGGWSKNAWLWSEKSKITIRFEDLIQDPIGQFQRLAETFPLPEPNFDKLPTFKSLKFGNPKYGGRRSKFVNQDFPSLFFRKGKKGSWKEEMSPGIEHLFWKLHGSVMEKYDYLPSEYVKERIHNTKVKRVLIEASRLSALNMDGISRYTHELINHMKKIVAHQEDWEIDLQLKSGIVPLHKPEAIQINKKYDTEHRYEEILLRTKDSIKKIIPFKLYQFIKSVYIKNNLRDYLISIRRYFSKKKKNTLSEQFINQKKQYDLIHVPWPQGFTKIPDCGNKHLVTIHDMIHISHPELLVAENIQRCAEGFELIDKFDPHFLCVSENTKTDLLLNKNYRASNTTVIHEGINPKKFSNKNREEINARLHKKYGLPDGPYILSLSTLEPRKNIEASIEAFIALKKEHPNLNIDYVIAGKKGWMSDDLSEKISSNNVNIITSGYIDDEDIEYIYAHATVFSYVSLYEGFGLPLIEAMACGTPVVYGNNSAMKEIIGDSGLAADTNNISAIKNHFYKLLTEPEYWNSISQKGWQRAQELTWLKTAFHTLELYERVINEK